MLFVSKLSLPPQKSVPDGVVEVMEPETDQADKCEQDGEEEQEEEVSR